MEFLDEAKLTGLIEKIKSICDEIKMINQSINHFKSNYPYESKNNLPITVEQANEVIEHKLKIEEKEREEKKLHDLLKSTADKLSGLLPKDYLIEVANYQVKASVKGLLVEENHISFYNSEKIIDLPGLIEVNNKIR
jgi:hypothetical protein